MIYAPVIVPTLCRYEHFKRLIESLTQNPDARHTDLYIALDFPSKESHWDGYNKIVNYLPTITGFNDVIIYKREHNYGERENVKEVREFVSQKYGYWIFTEDDNVCSPNFLSFINQGLEKYKDDPKVFAIEGYRHYYNVKFKNNNFYRQGVDFSAWGYGIWADKYDKMTDEMTRKYLRKKMINPIIFWRISKNGLIKLRLMMKNALSSKPMIYPDWMISLYLIITKRHVIMPKVSKVRNEGWDNSGINCKTIGKEDIAALHDIQELDAKNQFTYCGTGYEYFEQNRKIYVRECYERITFIGLCQKALKKLKS